MESENLIRDAFQAANGGVPDDIAVTIRTPEGDPGLVLTRIAQADGDVLVVGTEPGLRARRVVHGSVSRYCSDHARCPVVVVPAPGPGTGFPASDMRLWDGRAGGRTAVGRTAGGRTAGGRTVQADAGSRR
jgi:hypothetical protein